MMTTLPDVIFFEPLEILRQVPRDFVPRTDNAVQRHRGDGFEMFHFIFDRIVRVQFCPFCHSVENYTATGALMAGCGS